MSMIPDLQSALICDDVRQERSGKFILIGLFDTLGSPTFPFRAHRICLVTRWCSGEGEFVQKSRILCPDMKTIALEGREMPVRLPHGEATATHVEVFMNAEFRVPGTHWVEILLDGEMKIRFPLRVKQAKTPDAEPDVPPQQQGG